MSKDEGQQKARPRNEAKSIAKTRRTQARKQKNIDKHEARRIANLDFLAAHGVERRHLPRLVMAPVYINGRPSLYAKPMRQERGTRMESPSEAVARYKREAKR